MANERSQVGFDAGFFKSTDGVFKVVQLLLVLLLFIFLLASSFWNWSVDYVGLVMFIVTFSLVTLLISVVIYAFRLYTGMFLDRLPWKTVELFYAIANAVLHLIGMIVTAVAAANNTENGLFVAAAIFSVFVMVSFLMYAFIIFRGNPPRSAEEPDAY